MIHPLVKIAAGVAAIALARNAAKKQPRVFVSYHHGRDAKYRHLLDAWSANDGFDFDVERTSPTVEIDSEEAAVIKRDLARRLGQSDVLLVLVGKETSRRPWVRWEIRRARAEDINIPVVAVKLGRFKSPPELLNAQTIWVHRFSVDLILKALDEAASQ